MQYLDLNPKVLAWDYEGIVIEYVSNVKTGKKRKYYPDFFVTYVDGTKTLVEVKPLKRLHNKKVEKKLLAAHDWCRKNDVKLLVITEIELHELGLL
jgi:TnsA endonuclease N terminal.